MLHKSVSLCGHPALATQHGPLLMYQRTNILVLQLPSDSYREEETSVKRDGLQTHAASSVQGRASLRDGSWGRCRSDQREAGNWIMVCTGLHRQVHRATKKQGEGPRLCVWRAWGAVGTKDRNQEACTGLKEIQGERKGVLGPF